MYKSRGPVYRPPEVSDREGGRDRDTERRPPTKEQVLKILTDADGNLVPSRVFKEQLGYGWQDAMTALQMTGYRIDMILGASGNRSYRINTEQPFGPAFDNPPPLIPTIMPSTTVAHRVPMLRVTLPVEDIRALLRLDLPPSSRDMLVGALMAYEQSKD